MTCDGRTEPARAARSFVINDRDRGSVRLRIFDRPNMDDWMVHLVERELFRLAGGPAPSDDINPGLKDFLIRENYLEIR